MIERDFLDPESQHFGGVEIAYDKIILWHVDHCRRKLSQEYRGGRFDEERRMWLDDTREEIRNSVDTLLDLVVVLADDEYLKALEVLSQEYRKTLSALKKDTKNQLDAEQSYALALSLKSKQFRAVLALLYRKGFLGVTPEERSES